MTKFGKPRSAVILRASELLTATLKTPPTDVLQWDQFGKRALGLVNTMTWNNLALISNSFARANVRNEKLLKRVADRMCDDLQSKEKFGPKEIALVVNAYTKLNFLDENMFRDISQYLIQRGVSDFNEQHLALMVHSWGRFNLQDPLLMQHFFRRAIEINDTLTPQALANIAGGAAKLGERNVELFTAIGHTILTVDREYDAQHIANLLTAFAKMKGLINDEAVIKKLVGDVMKKHRSLRALEVAAIFGALSKLEYRDYRVYEVLMRRAQEDVRRYLPTQLAQVVHSLSTVHPEWTEAFESFAPELHRQIENMDDVTVLLILASYARAKVRLHLEMIFYMHYLIN